MGYWKDHEYFRRSVIKDIKGFVGWKELKQLSKKLKNNRDKALLYATYTTGGRISEVVQLKPENFNSQKNTVIINDMPLQKKYKKTGSWIESVETKPDNELDRLYIENKETGMWERKRYNTQKIDAIRNPFAFPINEPFVEDLLSWVDKSDRYLFPGYKDHIKKHRAYMILCKTGYYPHWYRAQRACCLASFYGFTLEKIMDWLSWDELTTARRYAKFGAVNLVELMMDKKY